MIRFVFASGILLFSSQASFGSTCEPLIRYPDGVPIPATISALDKRPNPEDIPLIPCGHPASQPGKCTMPQIPICRNKSDSKTIPEIEVLEDPRIPRWLQDLLDGRSV